MNLTSELTLLVYRTSPKEKIEIKKQIQNLLKAEREEGKKTRLCVAFRKINKITKINTEPSPQIDTLLNISYGKCPLFRKPKV